MRVFALGLLLVGLMATSASARIWTDSSGKGKVDAEFAGMEEGQVKLQFARTGKVVLVPLGTLSEDDQKFVKGEVAKQEAAKEAEKGPPDRFTQAITRGSDQACELHQSRHGPDEPQGI